MWGMELELHAFVLRGELIVSLPGLFQSSKICPGTYGAGEYLKAKYVCKLLRE
jgi:hypothetical protein